MAIIDNGSTLEPKPMLIQASAQELSDDYICIKFSQHIQGSTAGGRDGLF